MRPYILAETNWKNVLETNYTLAVLPWGATEAHNYHLPYGTDIFEADKIAAEAARIAWETGERAIVLPTIPFGVNTGQADIKLDMNMSPSTQLSVLKDIVHVLSNHQIHKLLILNSHGGNDFKAMIREIGYQYPSMFLSTCNWFQSLDQKLFFDNKDDHAGEMETSLLLHLAPSLVRPLSEAGNGEAKRFRFTGMQEGWAWAERKWSQVTKDTGVGDPSKATAEKGKKYFEAVTKKIADLLVQISQADTRDLYI